ncbi:MAG: TonB-dependent receptor [Candidatus Auribacterota bacterium]|nr:TonB-dependent receptor [Candidatus Auribacterota bacterium]
MLGSGFASGGGADECWELPAVVIREERTTAPAPAGTYAAPVSRLRFQPGVDLQSRNLAEAQADLSIRGGIFSETGLEIGAATLLDPQAAHYTVEVPIPPGMLTPYRVLTGVDNDLSGFNSMAGTVKYGWSPIETGAEIRAGLGDHRLNLQHVSAAYLISNPEVPTGISDQFGFDIDLARSKSDGTRPFGDYDFGRIAGRIQFRGAGYQSDIFCGYQSKFFGWPNMYTPEDFFDTDETESLHTTLVLLNHRMDYSRESHLEFTGYYRKNSDHYILQRSDPEIFQAFHRTRVWSGGISGRHGFGFIDLNWSGQISVDNLTSTALTYSPYYSRTIGKVAILPGKVVEIASGLDLSMNCGGTLDDSNRSSSMLSPLARLTLIQQRGEGEENHYYCGYGESSQLPSYTALGSPAEGLFGGNPDLGRERSRNLETGINLIRETWNLHAALFYRLDDDLVDWTYEDGSPNARTAAAVDIKCWGVEVAVNKRWRNLYLSIGYALLKKTYDYQDTMVDASFYALNYPRHRLTATLIWNFLEIFELRSGNEYRIQEDNDLRSGRDDACLTYFELACHPRFLPGLLLAVTADNPFKVNFQEIPGVPGPGRQFTCTAAYQF